MRLVIGRTLTGRIILQPWFQGAAVFIARTEGWGSRLFAAVFSFAFW